MASQENNNHVTPAAPHMRANRPNNNNNNNSGGRDSRGGSGNNNRVEGTEVDVVIKVVDHTISNTGHGINPHKNHGHILHGSLLHVQTLQLKIVSNQSLSTVNQTFLGRYHNKHMLLQHNHHTHQ